MKLHGLAALNQTSAPPAGQHLAVLFTPNPDEDVETQLVALAATLDRQPRMVVIDDQAAITWVGNGPTLVPELLGEGVAGKLEQGTIATANLPAGPRIYLEASGAMGGGFVTEPLHVPTDRRVLVFCDAAEAPTNLSARWVELAPDPAPAPAPQP